MPSTVCQATRRLCTAWHFCPLATLFPLAKIVHYEFGMVRFRQRSVSRVLHSYAVSSDGECVQTIVHPAISVWTVATMPNGDIVTGTSDGKVRIFSAVEERWAPVQELQAYDAELAATAVPAEQVGDVKKDELPGEEALLQPGE